MRCGGELGRAPQERMWEGDRQPWFCYTVISFGFYSVTQVLSSVPDDQNVRVLSGKSLSENIFAKLLLELT